MRLRRIGIDGYGRFSKLALDLHEGFQIVLGPNEKGKSTICCFICDMLYGQKRSLFQRKYDDNNELRRPWHSPECYGGTLVYTRARGQEVEVVRNFSRENEKVQVFDRSNGEDITGDFDLLRNREVDFARAHLGLGKEVFLGTATIDHLRLENLGDGEALKQIQEKLLSLADAGAESHSADSALDLLRGYMTAIGKESAWSKPLPAAKARLEELEAEHQAAVQLREELAETASRRQALANSIKELREERLELENEVELLEAHHVLERLHEAQRLQHALEAAERQCTQLANVRDFPSDQSQAVQEAESRLQAMRLQHKRVRHEYEQAARQLRVERRALGEAGEALPSHVPEQQEERILELSNRLQQYEERLEEAHALVQSAQKRLAQAVEHVELLPDFSRLSSDPVEWVSQLVSSFNATLRARDSEAAHQARLRAEITQRCEALASQEALFGEHPRLLERIRRYRDALQEREEEEARIENDCAILEADAEDAAARLPGFRWMAGICTLLLALLLAAFAYYRQTGVLFAAAPTTLALLYFITMAYGGRGQVQALDGEAAACRAQLKALREKQPDDAEEIEALVAEARCGSLRELEGIYEEYREARAELAAREEVLREHEGRAQEVGRRIPELLERFRTAFARIGVPVETEQDVQQAAGRALARYQEYREARRRVADSRAVLERHQAEEQRLQNALEEAEDEMRGLNAAVRAHMRASGFAEEAQYRQLAAAVRAFHTKVARRREQQSRLTLLQEHGQGLERQLKREELEIEKQDQALGRLLAQAGVSSLAQWRTAAAQATEYQELNRRRAGLAERVKAVLQGDSLQALAARAQAADDLPPKPERNVEETRERIRELAVRIDEALEEEHALHLRITEQSAGQRPLSELEEERTALEEQVATLDAEFASASHAAALIEEIARDTHARIAPGLAERAGRYLAGITGGAYSELHISRSLGVTVRIPETKAYEEAPERLLSKGTVDQVYLALRLALVQELSQNGEPVPMLLDDPLANYDDERLRRALELLIELGRDQQIILFTCREDVARAARELAAPIIELP